MRNLFVFSFLLSFILHSCIKPSDQDPEEIEPGYGAFFVNEGTFLAGNGSLAFFSYDSMKVYNDIFRQYNNRPLGDVPYSLVDYNGLLFIVVNNSGKIEVIDQNTFTSLGTFTGLKSPRKIAIVNDSKAYVTSLYSDSVVILDLKRRSIKGYIKTGTTTESIVVSGNEAFVSNWVGGNKIYVIDTRIDKVTDSISVGLEPESMVLDKIGRLWVLCTGGWQKLQKPEIDIIDADNHTVESKIIFNGANDSPSCLKIDNSKQQKIYFINNGAWQMDINSTTLPSAPLIPSSGRTFYQLAINPVNGDIFVTDAVNYVKNGYLLVYDNEGNFISDHNTGIIPGEICFKLTQSQLQTNY